MKDLIIVLPVEFIMIIIIEAVAKSLICMYMYKSVHDTVTMNVVQLNFTWNPTSVKEILMFVWLLVPIIIHAVHAVIIIMV